MAPLVTVLLRLRTGTAGEFSRQESAALPAIGSGESEGELFERSINHT